MRKKIIEEARIVVQDSAAVSLLVLLITFAVGLGILRFVSWRDPESDYVAMGTLMGMMVVAALELFGGSRMLMNDFNRAVGFGRTRKSFLISRLVVEYGIYLGLFLVIRLWSEAETWIGGMWFRDGLAMDIRFWLGGLHLVLYPFLLLGIKTCCAGLLMRYFQMAQLFMTVLWCVAVIGLPQMMDAVEEAPNSVWGILGRGIVKVVGETTQAAGYLVMAAVGIVTLAAGVGMLRRQRVTV
ncbi:MAG: hypothetical protein Q4F41_00280 [Eubacteriales bacterium]|nr:hypothetical protein [Eubacteriales bacterium]